MSTWTDEKHKAARATIEIGYGGLVAAGFQHDLAGALDEIERLRAESARRMVWLETEQRAHQQTHAALVDMTEHAAHPEITDDRVERAARGISAHWHDMTTNESLGRERALARAALEAALANEEEA